MSENQKYLSKLFIASFFATVLFLTFNGCITERHRLRICQSCPLRTITKDSLVYIIKEVTKEVIIRDTLTVTKWLENPCSELCDANGKLIPTFTKTLQSNAGTSATLSVKGGSLVISDNLNGLKTKAAFKDTTVKSFHSTLDQVPARCEREHKTWFDHLCNWVFWIVAAYVGLRVLRFYWLKR